MAKQPNKKTDDLDLSDNRVFEDILLKLMFTNLEVRERCLPFFQADLFKKFENKEIAKSIISIQSQYERFPSAREIQLDTDSDKAFEQVTHVMNYDLTDFDPKFLMDRVEEFYREQLITNVCQETISHLAEEHKYEFSSVDKLRDALGFSFSVNVGMDIFSERDRMWDFYHSDKIFVPSSIRNLNRVIQGGYHNKTLNLFLAGTNVGKSLIMTSEAVSCMMANYDVLYISCEMSEEKIGERIHANVFDVSIGDISKLDRVTYDKLYDKFAAFKQKFVLKEYPMKTLNANHIRHLLKELAVKKKFKPRIVFVDYLALMVPMITSKNANSYESVKLVSEELRAVAMEFDIPIVSAVQTGRSGITATDLELSDMSESIGQAFTADVVVSVTQSEELARDSKYNWTILKNRYGQKKMFFTVNVDYEKMRVTYDEEADGFLKDNDSKFDDNKKKIVASVTTGKKKKKNDDLFSAD